MAENSKIEWTDHTFNPWRGCAHKLLADGSEHPGCVHCYAEAGSKRNPATLGRWGTTNSALPILENPPTRVVAAEQQWKLLRNWNAAPGRINRVFCASFGDVFEDWPGIMQNAQGQPLAICPTCTALDPFPSDTCPSCCKPARRATMDHVRRRLFALIDATPNLFWLLLTKRPENVRRMWPSAESAIGTVDTPYRCNVAIGTSVSDQATADELVPKLLACRDLAPVLFLSVEPLVGPVDLTKLNNGGGETYDALRAVVTTPHNTTKGGRHSRHSFRTSDTDPIDWVIVGGESGHHARPMHPQWARDVRDQCVDAGVPFFFKQWGEWLPYEPSRSPPLWDSQAGTCVDANTWPIGLTEHKPVDKWWAPDLDRVVYQHVGKHAAGRLLDGREWSDVPAAFASAEAADHA